MKPAGFRYNTGTGTLDIFGFNMAQRAKYRNVRKDGRVAFVVDDDPGLGPAGMRFLEIRGIAETATGEAPWPGLPPEIIRIHPRRVLSINIEQDRRAGTMTVLRAGWAERHGRR